MKNLKKIVFGLLAMLVMVTSVNAAKVDDLVTAGKLTKTKDGIYQLTGDIAADIEIEQGQNVILDLAGHKLTNEGIKNSAIWVKRNAELTINDSSEDGNGIILYNESSESSEVPSSSNKTFAPIINNMGTLTINGGTIRVNKGASATETASGILNAVSGHLTFNGGSVRTKNDYTWGLVNDGVTVITGGEFRQMHAYSVIMNNNELTISGGTITADSRAGDVNSLITNGGNSALSIVEGENGMPVINPGKNQSNYKLFHNGTNVKIEISAGKFPSDLPSELIEDYLADNFTLENGVVATDADLTALNEAIAKAEAIKAEKDYATRYTDASRSALEAALDATEPALEYRSDKQAEIDSLAEALNNAIAELKTQHKVKLELTLDEVGDAHSVIPSELTLEAGKEYRLSQLLHLNLLDIVAYKDYTAYYTVTYGETVEHYTSSVGGKLPGAIVPLPILTKSTYSDSFVMPDEEITITVEIKKTEVVEEITTYTVEVVTPENGELTVDKTEAVEGDVVTVTVKAADGYKVAKVLVNGEEITANEDGTYAFEMPAENVTVSAEFAKIDEPVLDPGKTEDQNQPVNPEDNGEDTETENTPADSENQEPSGDTPVADEGNNENPSTLDSIVSIVTLAISSLGTAGYSIKKFIRK